MAKVVFFLVLLCTLLMPQHSYGEEGYLRGSLKLRNRKVGGGVEIKTKLVVAAAKYECGGRELREAPMGPDPLHHNGAPPRKPIRTTP